MHLSASKSVHFNAQEPTYAFSECDGGGDECSDDEYVFSCAFSDSLMKKCLKKKKEEEEEKKRREERRKKEEEERKRKEEEEKKKKEEEKKREAARRQEEAKKERQRQLDAVKTRFTTQLNELQKKSELLEKDAPLQAVRGCHERCEEEEGSVDGDAENEETTIPKKPPNSGE